MTLQDLGNIGEFIAAFGVIASLIYVGFQVRQNTKAMKAQIHESLTTGYLAVADTVATHATAFVKGLGSVERAHPYVFSSTRGSGAPYSCRLPCST